MIGQLKTDIVARERFRAAYAKAVLKEQSVFVFDGAEFYVPYAKYVLEYLDLMREKV